MTEISVIPAKAPSAAQQIGSEVFRHAKGLRDRAGNGTQEIARLAEVKTEQGDLHLSIHRESDGKVSILFGFASSRTLISDQQAALLVCEALSGFVRSF